MRLLSQNNVSDLSTTFFLPSGNWGGFLLKYTGTNTAAQTATRLQVGQVNLTYNGIPLINTDAEFLQYLTDLKGGFATFVSTAGAAFDCSIFIPVASYDDNDNSLLISKNDSVYFKLDYATLFGATSLASGTVKIYGIDKDGVQNYLFNISQRNVVAQGAGTITDLHKIDNIAQIYLKGTSVIDTIRIVKDDIILKDCLTADAKSLSDFINRVEAGTNILIELDLNASKSFSEALGREVLFNYFFNAAGTLGQYFAYKSFTGSKAVEALVINNQKLQTKIAKGISKEMPIRLDTTKTLGQVQLANKASM